MMFDLEPAVLQIETQSEDNEIIVLAHVNEKLLALRNSLKANVLYKNNREVFNKINRTTEIYEGKLTRHVITSVKAGYNKASVPIKRDSNYTSRDVASLTFKDNRAIRQERRRFSVTKTSDITGPGRKSVGIKNILDINNPTEDDIKNSKLISISEELEFLQNQGIRTFLFRDFLKEKEGLSRVSYSFTFKAGYRFDDYIQHIMNKLKKSLVFLENYSKHIELAKSYDYKSEKFKKFFKTEILESVGIKLKGNNIDTTGNKVKSSEYGSAIVNFYNANVLLKETSRFNFNYEKMVKALLPLDISSPETIAQVIKKFKNLQTLLHSAYYISKKEKNIYKKTAVVSRKTALDSFTVRAKRILVIENSKLGYNIFSNKQKGLVVFSEKQYLNRMAAEAAHGAGNSEFLTPAGIHMGQELIETDSNHKNISFQKIDMFRMLKSQRSKVHNKSFSAGQIPEFKVAPSIMSSFNLSVGPPIKSALELTREGPIDPFEDAAQYIGESSLFITTKSSFIERQKKKLSSNPKKVNLEMISHMVPNSFLKPPMATKSLLDLSVSNKNSKYSRAIANKKFKIEKIPPQIRSLTAISINKNEPDILRNRKTSGILQETRMNVFVIRALVGFAKGPEGFIDVNKPIIKDLTPSVLQDQNFVLAKAYHYEIPAIGILKDINPVTIYNNLAYIRR